MIYTGRKAVLSYVFPTTTTNPTREGGYHYSAVSSFPPWTFYCVINRVLFLDHILLQESYATF
jgi:hypothetical protein